MLRLSNLHLVSEHIPQEKIPQHKETLSNLQQTVKPLQELHKYKDSHYESQARKSCLPINNELISYLLRFMKLIIQHFQLLK